VKLRDKLRGGGGGEVGCSATSDIASGDAVGAGIVGQQSKPFRPLSPFQGPGGGQS